MTSAFLQQRSLSDLPTGALSHVSSFLALPSRALFAVALDYHDTDSSLAIVGDQLDVLDFGDIERELAAKLNDDDIRSVLLSIDAVINLKLLRLTNLLNISGIGLEPIRGSIMIEKIDLSLVRDHESPDLSPAPPISCIEVLPILDSIIDMGEASSLKLLIFPKEWREERNIESDFHVFLVRYNALLCSRVVTCLKCDENLAQGDSMLQMAASGYGTNEYGLQKVTCYDCMKHFCHGCEEGEDGEEIHGMSELCGICNRRYCFHCSWARGCTSCDEWFCVDCMDLKQCAGCAGGICLNCISDRKCRNNCCEDEIWCYYCIGYNGALMRCEKCDVDCCRQCCDSNTDVVHSIQYCDDCGKNLCRECRVIECKEKKRDGCMGCYQCALTELLEDKERQRQEMQAEIRELKRKLNDLTGEVEDELG